MDFDIEATRPAATNGPALSDEVDVGARIASLRSQRGWTLQEAARHTNVSFSTLSKIERHELSPTITTLTKIATGLGMRLGDLLDVEQPTPGLARRSISRRLDAGRATSTGTCNNNILCNDLSKRKMTPIRTTVRARTPSAYTEWASYNAEIFLTVEKGVLVVYSQSYAPTRLEKGDSMYYDASTGHLWVSEGEEDACVLWIISE